jgi:enamine deaminase RidA (YjgF/YER057c/UK114 family)
MQSAPELVAPNLTVNKVNHATWIDYYYTFLGMAPDVICSDQLETYLEKDNPVADIHEFGDSNFAASVQREIKAPETALLLAEGAPGGVQIRTLSGVVSTPLYHGGRIIGSFFEDADAKYCILGDIQPGDSTASPGEQTTDVMETIRKSLLSAGMDFQNVVRTWFYNDRILDWYAEFNRARSAFFQEHGITAIPASTGIGVANRAGAALVAKAIAVAPKNGHATIRRVESPLQCEASAYGSAFSRALEVADRAARVLYVSGTASIEANGDTAHVGNATKQIAKTMEVVEAILERNGMSLGETVRAIGYFRHREHIPLWEEYCRGRELAPMPIILTECEVCRANLLFEIELDVATAV